jgi:hypothetical protein
MKSIREEIALFEDLLRKATFGDYDEGKYSDISKIVHFIKSKTEGVRAE